MSRVSPFRVLFLIVLAFHTVVRGQQSTPAETKAIAVAAPPAAKAATEAARRAEAFEAVWRTVSEHHFDPGFGGVDWDAVRAEFAPRAAAARTDRELHTLLQQMLNRLGRSHFNIIPPEAIPSTEPAGDEPGGGENDDAGTADGGEEPRARGSRRVAEQLSYGVGMDVRVVGGALLVTRVEPGSTAERAGLRPGFVLRGIDGLSVSSILRQLRLMSVYEPAARNQIPSEILVGYVNGPAGTSVRLSFLDGRGRLRRAVVPRERLKGELTPTSGVLPAQFVEFEARRLRGGVGYVRFNIFAAPVLEKFCAALRSMKDTPGVVIDLRGNRGGLLGLVYGLGGLLESRPVSFGVMRTRAGWHDLTITPQKNSYAGRLVLLIDGETQSAGEILAAGLQASGRATVVGQRSAGATLPSAAKELPTGAILQYAFADFVTADGRLVEGSGVAPDVSVALSRRALLAGRDPQLEVALDLLTARHVAEVVAAPLVVGPPPEEKGAAAHGTQPMEGKSAPEAGGAAAASGVAPEVEPILERYEAAVGGREAFAKLSTRVSKGRIRGTYAGMEVSGTVELIEKSPEKFVALVNVAGLGLIRRGFTGEYGYIQIPLFGFRRAEGGELAELRLEARAGWAADLRALYPSMTLKGREQAGGAEAFVVEARTAAGVAVRLYFDARTGLLVRRDKTHFEDFREVDGVRLPFRIRDDFSVVTLEEVRHDLPVDDARFAEEKNCFTQ